MPVLHLLAPEEEAIASKACANKLSITILTSAEKEERPTLGELFATRKKQLFLYNALCVKPFRNLEIKNFQK